MLGRSWLVDLGFSFHKVPCRGSCGKRSGLWRRVCIWAEVSGRGHSDSVLCGRRRHGRRRKDTPEKSPLETEPQSSAERCVIECVGPFQTLSTHLPFPGGSSWGKGPNSHGGPDPPTLCLLQDRAHLLTSSPSSTLQNSWYSPYFTDEEVVTFQKLHCY